MAHRGSQAASAERARVAKDRARRAAKKEIAAGRGSRVLADDIEALIHGMQSALDYSDDLDMVERVARLREFVEEMREARRG